MPHKCSGCKKTVSDFEAHTCATIKFCPGCAKTSEFHVVGCLAATNVWNSEFLVPPALSPEAKAGLKVFDGLTEGTIPANKPTHHMCPDCGVWMPLAVNSHVCIPGAKMPDGSPVPQPISGVGHCPKCGYDYPRAAGHAVCQPAEQRTFFVLPPEPVAVAWSLQWRWTPATQQILALTIPADQLPTNDWVPHTAYQNVTTKAQARNAANRYRRVFPCKKWRVRPTSWRDHEGGIYQVVI